MNRAEIAPAIRTLLQRHGLVAAGAPTVVQGGTLNGNFRVETPSGPVFVRKHRPDQSLDRIFGEHALLSWLTERSIPVVEPIVSRLGETVESVDGAAWSIFPWVDGAPPERGAATQAQAHAMGAMHGRIHAVLLEHPDSSVPVKPPLFDVARSLRAVDALIDLADRADEPSLAADLRRQRELLVEHGSDAYRLDSIPNSISHGDYHDEQLLFGRDGQLAAVVDWEMFGMRPRAYEVVRALSFSRMLETFRLEAYVAGYREHLVLPLEDCEAAVELWWQSRIQWAWAFNAYLREGNQRVKELLPYARHELELLAQPAWRRDLATRMARAG